MAWIQIRINANADNAELISDLLMDTGSASVTYVDAKDTPIYEPKLGTVQLWADTTVIGLYDANHDMDSVVETLKAEATLADQLVYKIEQLEDKDWEREWMDNFHAMQFGKRLWICPSWRESPDPDAVNVLLDPGLAFGTGTHPTTALCLEWLDGLDIEGKTVIDFGCGSGILAIAALKLGAKAAIGIDIDPQAILASEENARRNGVEDKLTLYLAGQQPETLKSEVVVANILAGPLRELAPQICTLLADNGELCLSGVLAQQAPSVCDAYQDEVSLEPVVEREEWCRISGMKS